jgi:hypothetical protein
MGTTEEEGEGKEGKRKEVRRIGRGGIESQNGGGTGRRRQDILFKSAEALRASFVGTKNVTTCCKYIFRSLSGDINPASALEQSLQPPRTTSMAFCSWDLRRSCCSIFWRSSWVGGICSWS